MFWMNDKTITSADNDLPIYRLTYDGQDDDHKVKDVPADSEVVLPECSQLENALWGEDDDEDKVDPIENDFFLLTLLICLHHHGHHVETDQHHDEDVEELCGDQVKDQTLEFILSDRKRRNTWAHLIALNHVRQEVRDLTSGRGTGFWGFFEPSFFMAL